MDDGSTVILRPCRPGTDHKNPESRKYEKMTGKMQNPPPRVGPRKYEKMTQKYSMPNMTGRPGYWTMEMNRGSSAQYLACTPCVPLFVHCLIRVEAEGLLDYQGRAGIISVVRWNLRPVIFGVEIQKWTKNTTVIVNHYGGSKTLQW